MTLAVIIMNTPKELAVSIFLGMLGIQILQNLPHIIFESFKNLN